MDLGVTEQLAEWVAELRWETIPSVVRGRVSDLLVDAIGDGLVGHIMEETGQVARFIDRVGGAGQTTVLGGETTSQFGAAFMNGYLITAATVCDVYRPTHCHVGPEVIPAALAAAELVGATGAELLAAVAAGLEVTTRVGQALGPVELLRRGWHAPGVTGGFGAAAAAGKLLGLTVSEQAQAFGLAGSQASGTYAQWGTPAVKFHQAHGATSGLVAAMLVSEGFTATSNVFTAPNGGFLSTYTGGGDSSALIAGLGSDWELMGISLRLWPTGSPIQSVPTALFALMGEHPIDPDQVVKIRITLPSAVHAMHGEFSWSDPFSARLSPQYVAAVTVLDSACWCEQFTESRIADLRVNDFATNRVELEADSSLPGGAAGVDVKLMGGESRVHIALVPRGDPSAPLTNEELMAKFRACGRYSFTDEEVSALLPQLQGLHSERDVGGVLKALRRPANHPTSR